VVSDEHGRSAQQPGQHNVAAAQGTSQVYKAGAFGLPYVVARCAL